MLIDTVGIIPAGTKSGAAAKGGEPVLDQTLECLSRRWR